MCNVVCFEIGIFTHTIYVVFSDKVLAQKWIFVIRRKHLILYM